MTRRSDSRAAPGVAAAAAAADVAWEARMRKTARTGWQSSPAALLSWDAGQSVGDQDADLDGLLVVDVATVHSLSQSLRSRRLIRHFEERGDRGDDQVDRGSIRSSLPTRCQSAGSRVVDRWLRSRSSSCQPRWPDPRSRRRQRGSCCRSRLSGWRRRLPVLTSQSLQVSGSLCPLLSMQC